MTAYYLCPQCGKETDDPRGCVCGGTPIPVEAPDVLDELPPYDQMDPLDCEEE